MTRQDDGPQIDIDHSVFVVGTDTGVGKTRVAVTLVRQLATRGRRVVGMKPVAAGAEQGPAGWRNDDALALAAAGSVGVPYGSLNPCCLPLASSPHLAAADVGLTLTLPPLVEAYQSLAAAAEVVIVEGAGGWFVPLADPPQPGEPGLTLADLAVALQLPVLLVVGIRLGCLNHALLTAAALQRSGLPVAGWVANVIDPDFPGADRYVESLDLRLPFPRRGYLPFAA
jgi:dethiobiotin synthetase